MLSNGLFSAIWIIFIAAALASIVIVALRALNGKPIKNALIGFAVSLSVGFLSLVVYAEVYTSNNEVAFDDGFMMMPGHMDAMPEHFLAPSQKRNCLTSNMKIFQLTIRSKYRISMMSWKMTLTLNRLLSNLAICGFLCLTDGKFII